LDDEQSTEQSTPGKTVVDVVGENDEKVIENSVENVENQEEDKSNELNLVFFV